MKFNNVAKFRISNSVYLSWRGGAKQCPSICFHVHSFWLENSGISRKNLSRQHLDSDEFLLSFPGHTSFCSFLRSDLAFDVTEPFSFTLNPIFSLSFLFLPATFPFIYKTVKAKSMLFSVRQAAETSCPDTMCPDCTSPCQSNKKITATHFAFQCIFMKWRRDSNTAAGAAVVVRSRQNV